MAQSELSLGSWFYDRVMNYHIRGLSDFKGMTERAAARTEKLSKIIKMQPDLEGLLQENLLMEEWYEKQLRIKEAELVVMREAKPFLVGPATIESLINHVPDSFDYIIEGKLPFDVMFFNLAEGFGMHVPFHDQQINVGGLLFMKSGSSALMKTKSAGLYTAWIYCIDPSQKMIMMSVKFNPQTTGRFEGFILSDEGFAFTIETASGIVKYSRTGEIVGDHVSQEDFIKYLDNGTPPVHEMQLESSDATTFMGIANLCTNLVNYINAQNTTIVKRERTVDILVRNERGKRRRETRKQDYYLVAIAKSIVEEPSVPTGIHWTLQERIYVRGHDRKYRGDNGEIYRTVWIEPYVKGPDGAPWRNQRYQLLGELLEKEKALMTKHLK